MLFKVEKYEIGSCVSYALYFLDHYFCAHISDLLDVELNFIFRQEVGIYVG